MADEAGSGHAADLVVAVGAEPPGPQTVPAIIIGIVADRLLLAPDRPQAFIDATSISMPSTFK